MAAYSFTICTSNHSFSKGNIIFHGIFYSLVKKMVHKASTHHKKKKMHTSIVQMAMITGQYWSKDAWWRDEAIRSAERLAIQLQAGQKMTQYVLLLIFAARSNPTFCKVKQRASNSSNANTPLLETRDLYFSL